MGRLLPEAARKNISVTWGWVAAIAKAILVAP